MRPRADSVPGDGYDADEGPLESGLASESIDLSEILDNAEADAESLAVAPEDLGRRALREAAQQDETITFDASVLDEDSLEPRTLLDTDESDVDSPGESRMEPSAVDLTDGVIQEGSIFDQPRAGEMAQVRHPMVKANEVDETLEHNQRAQRAQRARKGR